jgi:hypothetical protein
MGKYENLGAFLQKQRTREVPLTFREIEKITGVKLPPKAQHHRAWWSNNPSNNVMTKVWLNAGYESAQVDMSARKLVFRRVVKAGEASGGFAEAAPKPYATKRGHYPAREALKGMVHIPPGVDSTKPAELAPAATKKGERHPIFGALKDITRLVPGVDLTEPGDPEWADLLDKKYGPQVR